MKSWKKLRGKDRASTGASEAQKLQSLRDEQRNHLKNARDCEEEMQILNREMVERKALFEMRFRALSEKSDDSRQAAAEWENEIQNLQTGEERRGSSASQSNEAALIQRYGSRSSERHGQQVLSKTRSKSLSGSTEHQAFRSKGQEEKRGKRGKSGMRARQMSGMKALRWIVLWILIGVRMQMVEVAEEEIPARREMERMLETARSWQDEKKKGSFDEGRRAGEHWQKEKSKNSQGKDPRTFEENSQVSF